MCEVTRKNFDEIYSQLFWDLDSASFISIDCEFSGICDDLIKYSLFDSPEARFNKLQTSLANFSIIQFGLSTFKYNSSSNFYAASTYKFYLKPLAGLGSCHTKFSFHPGSVQFLCKNNFDFNKLFYEGINYVGLYSEGLVQAKIKDNSLINREDYAKDFEKYCSEVFRWLRSAKDDDEMSLKVSDEDSTFVCLLHQEIRKRFHNTWTYFEEGKVVRIRKITPLERNVLLSHDGERLILETEIFHSLIGFSRVMRVLTHLGKPIVGHNILVDLIMIYKQFCNPLPVSYEYFKRHISVIFPIVFDTKHISFTLREFLSKKDTWSSNSLSDLYNYLKCGKGAKLVIFSPVINHTNEGFIKKAHFHDAGFDSYCTGYCFLKLAHIFSLRDPNKKNCFQLTTMRPTNTWLLGAVAPMVNKVNMSRGQVDYIVLGGKDPRSSRPGPLYIESKTGFPLEISKLSEMTAKYSVDILPLTRYSAVMAVSNKHQVQEILARFKCDKEVKVTKYSFLKHKLRGEVLKAALVASIILMAVYLSRGWRTTWRASGPCSIDCVLFGRRFLL